MSETPKGRMPRWAVAEAERDALRQDAANVLARIHRDGGHHTAEVGWRQSCLDAEQMWISLRAELDEWRVGVNALHSRIKKLEAERDALRAEIARRDHVAHVIAAWRPDR